MPPGTNGPKTEAQLAAADPVPASGCQLHQHIPYPGVLAKLRLGIRAQGHDLGLGFARPGHQRIQQLAAYALPGQGRIDLGVVDDDQRGVGPAVGHLGEVAALGAGDEEGAFRAGFLVLDGVSHGPDFAQGCVELPGAQPPSIRLRPFCLAA